MQEANSGQHRATPPSAGTEPCLYFRLPKSVLLLAEAAGTHAGVCPLSAPVRCKKLTGGAGRIRLARVFVHNAEEMQLKLEKVCG